MAAWQPPIPAGTLYSEPALRLGPALALLAWCYDRVERDGSLKFRLESASTDIGRPYGTIRDWWRLLREGDFFIELVDHGRNGWGVRFHPDYLDWRIMRRNYPEINADSTQNERRDVSVEEPKQPEEAAQSEMNEISTTSQSRDVSVDGNAYKVLHDDQNKHARSSRKRSDVHSSEEEKQERTPAVIRSALYDTCQISDTASRGVKLNANSTAKRLWQAGNKQGKSDQEIADTIRYVGSWCRKNPACWQCKDGSAPTPKLIGDYWRQAIEARASPKNGTNGHHPPPIAAIPEGDEQATEDDWKAVIQGLNGIGIHNDTLPTTPAQSGSRKRPDRLPSGES